MVLVPGTRPADHCISIATVAPDTTSSEERLDLQAEYDSTVALSSGPVAWPGTLNGPGSSQTPAYRVAVLLWRVGPLTKHRR